MGRWTFPVFWFISRLVSAKLVVTDNRQYRLENKTCPESWKWTSEYWVYFKTGKSTSHIKMCKSPVGIWPYLSDFGLLLPSQKLILVGNIEEEILHVNRWWWIYPALQYSTVLSQCDLLWMKQSQGSRESTKGTRKCCVYSKRLNSIFSAEFQ